MESCWYCDQLAFAECEDCRRPLCKTHMWTILEYVGRGVTLHKVRCTKRCTEDINQAEESHLYHTQGGGTVEWDTTNRNYVFVKPPPDFPNIKAGDFIPEGWGIT